MAWTPPWNLLGIEVSGDLADITIYTDRFFKKIAYPKSPPKEPPSAEQITLRSRFRTAVLNWKAAPEAVRQAYEAASIATSIPCTGHNVWVSTSLSHQTARLRTLERQSGIILADPPLV